MKDNYTIKGVGLVMLIFGICFIPWFVFQNNFNKKVLLDTYDQNIRMEKRMDSLADSILKNQKRIIESIRK